jgi:hypothetical protein
MLLVEGSINSGVIEAVFCLQEQYKTDINKSVNRSLFFIIDLFYPFKIDSAKVDYYLSSM